MTSPAIENAVRGTTANGVPFMALPPDGDARALVVAWHGGDPPRSEEALAGAVPMAGLPVWRVYLGLPMFGPRMPEGGLEEIGRRNTTDPLALVYHPIMTGAANELRAAVDDIRRRYAIDPGLPIGLFGFSMGGGAALLAAARRVVPVRAVATFGAVVDVVPLVDLVAKLFGVTYEWTDQRRALAEDASVAHRAADFASGPSLLLAYGSEDEYPLRDAGERLVSDVRALGGPAESRVIEGAGHGFVDEPGLVAAPQGHLALAIDRMVSDWFRGRLL